MISFAIEELMLKGAELRFKANIKDDKSESVACSAATRFHQRGQHFLVCFCFANEMIFLQLVPFPSFPDSSPKTGR